MSEITSRPAHSASPNHARPAAARKTLAGTLDPRRNSLNCLRLIFAVAVIVSHAWATGGYGAEPTLAGLAVGEWAVVGFFAISGYLIAKSRVGTSFPNFLGRRVFRIYPGYLVCLIVIAVVFAPLSVAFSHGSVDWDSAASFVTHNLALKTKQGFIASTLEHTPSGSNWWDVSLWTLFYEFACYLVIGLVLSVPARYRRALVIVGFVVLGGYAAVKGGGYPGSDAGTAYCFAWLGSFFFAGSLLALYERRLPLNWPLGVALFVVLPVASELKLAPILAAIPAAYVVLLLGARLPLHRIGRVNDISYGTYIYAFPVQQLINQWHADRLPVGLAVLLAIALTLPLAAASWFLVEKPFLAWSRRYFSGRGRPPLRPTRSGFGRAQLQE